MTRCITELKSDPLGNASLNSVTLQEVIDQWEPRWRQHVRG